MEGLGIQGNRTFPLLIITVILLLIISAACSYSFRGSLPEHLQSVKISPIRSRVTQYGLEQDITSRITEMMVRDGRLAVVLEEQDSEIEGTIASYSRTPYSYTSSEQVEEYKLEIRVEITFIDLLREIDIISNESVTTWLVYDPDAETEIDARNRLLEESAKDIVRRCLSGW